MEGRAAPNEFEVAIDDAISAPEAFGASFDAAPPAGELELGEGLDGDPALAFRRTLGMFATGVTVLTTRVGEQIHGMTANAFMSVSLRPPLVLVSIDRRARMGAMLHEGTRFGVSVLEAHQTALSDRFAGRIADEPPEAAFEVVHETPLVDGALAHLVARVVRSYWGGDHSLFLGQVEFARYGEGSPLLFHGGRYERLIEDARVFSLLPRELLDPILALGEERTYADGEPVMQRGEPGSGAAARHRGDRARRAARSRAHARPGRADRRDRGARSRRRADCGHPCSGHGPRTRRLAHRTPVRPRGRPARRARADRGARRPLPRDGVGLLHVRVHADSVKTSYSSTSRPGVVLAVLAVGGGAYALLQSLVVPALPTLQKDLDTTPAGVTWIFTAYLLAASVATPIAGRVGDMFGKKRTLVVVLAGVARGTLVAALATTLPVMIGARTIQGLGGAIFPLAFGIIRDEFPRERVAGGIGLISGLLGIGGGLGIVLAGPILGASQLPLAVLAPVRRPRADRARDDAARARVADPRSRRDPLARRRRSSASGSSASSSRSARRRAGAGSRPARSGSSQSPPWSPSSG